MPLAAIGILGAIGSIGGAAIASHGAGQAAKAQVGAANSAAQLQHQDAQAALEFQKQQYATQQQNMAPWLKARTGAIGNLSSLLSTPGQGLLTPWNEQFQAPTSVTEQNDPGYQFRLQQGQQALQNSAAARGGLLSGNTAKALNDYSQDYASNEYSNVYNRSLGEYQQRYNIFQNNQANEYNRLAGLSGAGQTAAAQLGQAGQAASGNISNILLTSGNQIGNSLQNAGAARASGYAGSANAWSGGFSGALTSLQNMLLLQQMGGLGQKPDYSYMPVGPG